MGTRPTIKEVAAAAGVSFSTAASALRGEGKVREATRERVERAARALGYRRNWAASALASSGDRGELGGERVVYLLGVRGAIPEGVRDRARMLVSKGKGLGFQIEVVKVNGLSMARRELRRLYYRGIRGILLGPFTSLGALRRDLPLDDFVVVALGRGASTPRFHCVRPDVMQAVRICYHHLRQSGCRRIAASFHRHQPALRDDWDRVAAYGELWSRDHPGRLPLKVFDDPVWDPAAYRAWLEEVRPDGIIVFSVRDYHLLRELGVAVPLQMRVACLHVPGEERDLVEVQGPVVGAMEDHPTMQDMALSWLDQALRRGHSGLPAVAVEIVVPCLWVTEDGQRQRADWPAISMSGATD